MDTDSRTQGWTQDFLKRRSDYLKKGVWDVASEAIGSVLLKHQNHTECKTLDNISLKTSQCIYGVGVWLVQPLNDICFSST